MKKAFLILILAVIWMTACGDQSEVQSTEVSEPEEVIAAQSDASEVEEPGYEDLLAPFTDVHPGAQVSVKARENLFEIRIVCQDLSADVKPENWDTFCTSVESAVLESQAVSDSNYEEKAVNFRVEDPSGAILCSGYTSGIQYNAFKTASEAAEKNDAKITLAEYNQIAIGMTYSQVCEIIGGEGTLSNEIGSAGGALGSIRSYTWEGTTEYGSASMSFDDYVLYSMFQVGLE